MNGFGNVLLAGAGPAAIQTAILFSSGFSKCIGMTSRNSNRTQRMSHELNQNQFMLSAETKSQRHHLLEGNVSLNNFYSGFETVEDVWDTLIMCIPCDGYLSVLSKIPSAILKKLETIILLSPCLGSNFLVSRYFEEIGTFPEVISLSTYYAATKLADESRALWKVVTKGVKKRIYASTNRLSFSKLENLQNVFASIGVRCSTLSTPMEAESRSIVTYVHPPFFMSSYSLDIIFGRIPEKKYAYKLFPEGPITPSSIHDMRNAWLEICSLLSMLNIPTFNLLQFLNDDNYPVREESLKRIDMEQFESLEPIRQEYLLYIRYASLLIDPFSQPDDNGRYFEFSAVPFNRIYQDGDGKWYIPRLPLEDYKRMKVICGMGEYIGIEMPTIQRLILNFENASNKFVEEKGRENVSETIFYDQSEALSLICREIDQIITIK